MSHSLIVVLKNFKTIVIDGDFIVIMKKRIILIMIKNILKIILKSQYY